MILLLKLHLCDRMFQLRSFSSYLHCRRCRIDANEVDVLLSKPRRMDKSAMLMMVIRQADSTTKASAGATCSERFRPSRP